MLSEQASKQEGGGERARDSVLLRATGMGEPPSFGCVEEEGVLSVPVAVPGKGV